MKVSRPRLTLRKLGLLAVLVTLLLAVLYVSSSTASFPPIMSRYTRAGNDCEHHLVDPINVMFYGPRAYPSHDEHLMERYGGWTNKDGSAQSVWTQHRCKAMNGQRADNCAICNRDHMRFFFSRYADNPHPVECGRGGGPPPCETYHYTGGDAHHDTTTYCGHKSTSSGYDDTRGYVYELLYGHVSWLDYGNWGNTGRLRQCDGSYARSDGKVLFVHTHAAN